jgi:competence protein ComEC
MVSHSRLSIHVGEEHRGLSDVRYEPLVVVAIAMAAGIVVDRHRLPATDGIAFGGWWWLALALLAAWYLAWRRRRSITAAWLLLAAVALSGAAWHELRWREFPSHDVARYAAREATPACATAIVLSAPEILPAPRPTPLRAIPVGERSRVRLEMTGIRDVGQWRPAAGHCQLTVDGHLLGVHAGDRIRIFGKLRRPSSPMNPGEFDFAAHSRAERRLATLVSTSPESVAVVEPSSWWSPRRSIDAVRASGLRTIDRYIGPRQAGLASAILLGARDGLPREDVLPFFLTGTIHLLVVSGLNVGILATGLYALAWMGWVPRRVALAATMAIVVGYTLLADAQPPVVRAAILVVFVCLAAWTGRRAIGYNSLAAAAIAVLAYNPSELFKTGTQLSFLCVAVLMWLGLMEWKRRQLQYDPLDQLIYDSRPWHQRAALVGGRWFALLMISTSVVWLATLPLVAQQFHLVSTVALLISPVVLFLAVVAMWAGFLTLLGGWVMMPLAMIAGPVCGWALAALTDVVNWAESLPAGHFWVPGPAWWWVIAFYLGFLAAILWGRAIVAPRWQVAILCAWILVGLMPPLVRAWSRGDELRCSFVAVGHGTCVVLETPDGRTLLYDAGMLGPPDYATQTIAGYLWDRGILRIDAIILSHADVDHYNAVPGLLDRFHVGTVYVSPLMFDEFGATGPTRGPEMLRRAIVDAGVPLREIWSGDRLRVGEAVTVDVLHPPRGGVIGRDNANSITASVEYAGRRLLLPGDLESPGLDDVLAELPLDCDVVMAPHHGSRMSDPPGFAAWSTPEWVVLSGGADADSDVRATYEQAGAQVFNTGEVGAVELRLTHDEISAAVWRESAGK